MKIAIVLFGTTGRGGMETVIGSISRGLQQAGHQCEIFLLGGSFDMTWTTGLPVTTIGQPQEAQKLRYMRYLTQFPVAFRRFNPDAVLCADPRATLLSARLVRVLRMETKVVSWPHFTLKELSDRTSLLAADLHFAISSSLAAELRELTGQDQHVYTVFNPVEGGGELLPTPTVPTFLIMGRLQIRQQKRTDDVLRAAARLHGDFRIRVVGAGDDAEALKQLSEELGLAQKIDWLGWQAAPWQVAGPVSCTVLSSAYEGFGMVLVESLARGVPVISTDCPTGPADIVQPGVNGWLYDIGDLEALTGYMQAIVDTRHDLSAPAQIAASVRKFDVDQVVVRMLDALQAEGIRSAPDKSL
ncbi:glycosyltransferase [Deinococcus sp. PESE-13]